MKKKIKYWELKKKPIFTEKEIREEFYKSSNLVFNKYAGNKTHSSCKCTRTYVCEQHLY